MLIQKSTRSTQSLYYTNHVLLTRSTCLSSSFANHATCIFQLTSNLPVNLELRTLNLCVGGCAICDDVGFCVFQCVLDTPTKLWTTSRYYCQKTRRTSIRNSTPYKGTHVTNCKSVSFIGKITNRENKYCKRQTSNLIIVRSTITQSNNNINHVESRWKINRNGNGCCRCWGYISCYGNENDW